MGRLFWKFFLFCWLMQMLAVASVGLMFRMEHAPLTDRLFAESQHFPPPPGFPPPPQHHRPAHFPVEPILAGLATSLICALWMAWYFSKPIKSLRKAFEEAATGNLDYRLAAVMGHRSDELADLGRDFDHMAGQIKALMESQRRLLHDVSHELRSPLARLQVAIGLAHQNPEKINDTLARVEMESERMEKLVGELLTLSRLEAGILGNWENVQMEELIAELVSDAQFEADAAGVSVVLVGNPEALVNGNPELLRHAIENVVRNAIKHTPEKTLIRIQAEIRNVNERATFVLAVCDNGCGVAEANLQKIFEPFFREDAAPSAQKHGYGLGLAIARRVIEAHGGSVTAFNLVGAGLCMEIHLPVAMLNRS